MTAAQRIRTTGPGTGPDHPGTTRLVVGHDASPAGQSALTTAADLARRLHAVLHVVHTIDLSDYPIDPDAADWEERADVAIAQQEETVRQSLAYHPGAWCYEVWRGDPATVLATAAADLNALMIIIGARSRGLAGLLRMEPSVAHRLPGRTNRPVLLVPAHEDP